MRGWCEMDLKALLSTPECTLYDNRNMDTWIRRWIEIDPRRVAQREIQNKIIHMNIPGYDNDRFIDWIEWIIQQDAQM
jgi:hypothetical protein